MPTTDPARLTYAAHITPGRSEEVHDHGELLLFNSEEERRLALHDRISGFADMLGDELDEDAPIEEIEQLFRLYLEPDGRLVLYTAELPVRETARPAAFGRVSEEAAARIEGILDLESAYDFTRTDGDQERRGALRDLFTDALHAADEWGFDIEQLVGDAVDLVSEENESGDADEFFAQASRSISKITGEKPEGPK